MVTLDLGLISTIVSIGGVLVAVIAALFKLLRRLEKVEEATIKNEETAAKNEETAKKLCKSMFAVLDGLKQLGCNGEVTRAHAELREHVIDQ